MTMKDVIPWRNQDRKLSRPRERNRYLDFQKRMDHLMDDFFGGQFNLSPFFEAADGSGDFIPKLDVKETGKEIQLSAELPGMEPEDIEISMDGNSLIIRGEKKAEEEDKGDGFYHVERSYGSFYRSIPLPSEVEESNIEATLKKGLLKIKLPKTQEAQKKHRKIQIKAS